ncbi:MAG: hypothetical protein IPN10_02965 [Saprospiraceae bacterium]|nr:hypothetical protein [Saprospiraceae bacterium]
MKIWKIWLGGNPIPEGFKKYTDTWNKISGGEIITVTDDNLHEFVTDIPHIENIQVRNHLVRYLLLYNYGGIYLDLDVEVIRDGELWHSPHIHFGYESESWVNNHVMITGKQDNLLFQTFALNTIAISQVRSLQEVELETGPRLVTNTLHTIGEIKCKVNNIFTHPESVFSGHRWYETYKPEEIRPETLSVHHYLHSWGKNPKV